MRGFLLHALYQSVAHAVESLQVELFVSLDGNKPHALPGHGFGDGLNQIEPPSYRAEYANLQFNRGCCCSCG
jgi:hypothetical protein